MYDIYHIYCDGACSKNGSANAVGGFGVSIYKNINPIPVYEESGKLIPATSNIAELVAAIQGCRKGLELSRYPDDKYNVYLDSGYIYNCYDQKWYKRWMHNGWVSYTGTPVANQRLWQQLIPFFKNHNFNFIKVRGHVGNIGNERVDTLAVQAKLSDIPVFHSDYYGELEW